MGKKKKRIIMLSICCVCAVLVGIRIYIVNKNVNMGTVIIYEKGEEVEYGQNFTEDSTDIIDGYTVTVKDAELVPVREYYEKYLNLEAVDQHAANYFYVVRAEFKNKDCDKGEKTGVNLTYALLMGVNYHMTINYGTFLQLNPRLEGLGFSLNKGDSVEVLLPYAIYPQAEANMDKMKTDPPMLQITEYPVRQLLKIE